MSDGETPQAIDLDAIADGLKIVRLAAPEAPFVAPTIPTKLPSPSIDDLAALFGAAEAVRGAMVRESEGLANEITIIALNTHRADQPRLEQQNAPDTGTTSTTAAPTTTTTAAPTTTTTTTSVPAADSTEEAAPPTGTTTPVDSTPVTGTTVPSMEDPG